MYDFFSMERFLGSIDELDLIKRIQAFRKLNIQNLTDVEIGNSILDTLLFSGKTEFIVNI